MANQELLTRFLVESLLNLDPTLSDSPGSPMYQHVVNPTLARMGVDPIPLNIEDFITARMKEDPLLSGLDIDTEGSFFKDILARAMMVLLEPHQREVRHISTQQSFSNLDQMTTDEADSLLANFLVTRNPGALSEGIVRVFFSSPRPVAVDASIIFHTGSGIQFIPIESQVRTEADFVQDGSLYYVDFDVQSVVAHIGTRVARNTIKFVVGLPNVVRVANPLGMTGGTTEQTKEGALQLARDAVSERSANNARGLRRLLSEQFPDLLSTFIVGYRDLHMNRDLLTGTVTTSIDTVPGAVVFTVSKVQGWPLVIDTRTPDAGSSLPLWHTDANVWWTNVVFFEWDTHADFLAAWDKMTDVKYIRMYHTGTKYDADHVHRVRQIKSYDSTTAAGVPVSSGTSTAVAIRVILTDFEILAHGNDATTSPHTNEYSDQGPTYELQTYVSGSDYNWRGAPLPFTDIVDLVGADLAAYAPMVGRDWLLVRGKWDGGGNVGKMFRSYPIRRKLSDTRVQVHRTDSYLNVRSSLDSTTTWVADKYKMFLDQNVHIRAYGTPPLGDPTTDHATMFDGITTVSGGTWDHGGVALYSNLSATPDDWWVRLAPAASRPNGWLSYGVKEGDFISLAGYHGTTDTPTVGDAHDWWQWGRVVQVGSPETVVDYHYIKVHGIDTNSLEFASFLSWGTLGSLFSPTLSVKGFPTATPYRLAWCVYRDEIEAVLPNGNIHPTYTHLAFPPAFTTSGDSAHGYDNDLTYQAWIDGGPDVSADRYVNYMFRHSSSTTGHKTIAAYDTQQNWAIVRLDEDWLEQKKDDGTLYLGDYSHAELMTVDTSLNALAKYQETRVDGSHFILDVPCTNPFAHREYKWSDLGGSSPTITDLGSTTNDEGIRGFTLSKDIGTVLGYNVAQALKSSDALLSDPEISITDIPGGYPFTEEFGEPVTVSSGSVHLGGCLDAYVKSGGVDIGATAFPLSPDDITVGSAYDVVYADDDGAITTANPKYLYSSSLSGSYTSAQMAGLWNHAIEIVSSTYDSIVGKTYRIIGWDHSAGFLRFGSTINDSGVDLTGITYRIVQTISSDLGDPHKVIQEGNDLIIPPESKIVSSSSAWPWDDLLLGKAYLEILSGLNKGEYGIETKSGSQVTLDVALSHTETNVPFRVYTKSTGIDYPLVRLQSVQLSSDESAGVAVPYRKAVDALAESFSGLNNDPVVESSNSWVLRPAGTYAGSGGDADLAHASGTYAYAQMYSTAASFDWQSEGIIKYDVVRISGQTTDSGTFFWIRDAAAGPVGSTTKVLLLDHDIDDVLLSLNGSVGKASLGNIRMFFLDKTYVSVGPSTVFKTLDGAVSFRPSPAEEAVLYSSLSSFTDAVITSTSTTAATLKGTTHDWQRLGVEAGDKVEILKRVITSGTITTPSDLSTLNNKALVLLIAGVTRTVILIASGTLTLDGVVQQINDVVGSSLRAKKSGSNVLKLYSTLGVTVLDSSAGVLEALQLTVGTTNTYLDSSFSLVSSVSYNTGTSTHELVLTDTDGNPSFVEAASALNNSEVFVTISRSEYQSVFPSSFLTDDSGLHYFDVTCSSRAPLSTDRLSEDTQMTSAGYDSLGYEVTTTNNSYTFSAAEKSKIVVTPTILPDYATDFETGFCALESSIDVEYGRSQLVEDVQSFLLNSFNRVVDTNPLARHYLPGYLYITMRVESNRSNEEHEADLASYISTLYPNKIIEPFDLEQVLARQGVTAVQHPITMFFVVHNEDRTITVVRDNNALTLLDERYHIMEDTDNIQVLSR